MPPESLCSLQLDPLAMVMRLLIFLKDASQITRSVEGERQSGALSM